MLEWCLEEDLCDEDEAEVEGREWAEEGASTRSSMSPPSSASDGCGTSLFFRMDLRGFEEVAIEGVAE